VTDAQRTGTGPAGPVPGVAGIDPGIVAGIDSAIMAVLEILLSPAGDIGGNTPAC